MITHRTNLRNLKTNYNMSAMLNDTPFLEGRSTEQEERNDPLTFEKIQKAIIDLYDSYSRIPEDSRAFIEAVYKKEDLYAFYKLCRELEQENKDVLVGFQEDYPGVLNGDNLAEILKAAKAKKTRTVPLAYGSLTKEQFDTEIEKGMADVKAGGVYAADAIETEMEGEKTTE